MITPTSWGYVDDLGANTHRIFVREGCRTPLVKFDAPFYITAAPDSVFWLESSKSPEHLDGIWMEENFRVNTEGQFARLTAIKDSVAYCLYDQGVAQNFLCGEVDGGSLADEEFKSLLSQFIKWSIGTNILEVDEAGAVADAIRDRRVIGFVNGCFDLLHLGHAELLLQAKQRCEALFVAVNSDESIRKLKGDARPFVDEAGRTGLVASMRFVDYVVRNPGFNCTDAVKAVRPHVYVTTDEYGKDGPEAVAAAAMGAAVDVIDKLPGYSTTKTANTVAKSLSE